MYAFLVLKWPMPVSQQIGTPCQRWKRDEGDKEDVPLRVKRERVPILTATEVLAAEAYWSEKEKKSISSINVMK